MTPARRSHLTRLRFIGSFLAFTALVGGVLVSSVVIRNRTQDTRSNAFDPNRTDTAQIAIAGDWDNNGTSTIGLFDQATAQFMLRNANTTGAADQTFTLFQSGAKRFPLVGKWESGNLSVGVYDQATGTFYLRRSLTDPFVNQFVYGPVGKNWLPVAGDWDGDGVATIGLYDPVTSTFHLRNGNSAGADDMVVTYGATGSSYLPIAGDWDGDGKDTIGLYQTTTGLFLLRNSNTTGDADITFPFGNPGMKTPIVGDWTGTHLNPTTNKHIFSVGLHTQEKGIVELRNESTGGVADATFSYGEILREKHRIGVRMRNGKPEFVDTKNGTSFIARGANYIRIAPQNPVWGGADVPYHAVFDEGRYNATAVNAALTKMNSVGYNTVRVFISNLTVDKAASGLSGVYLDNVTDFLRKAAAKNIYTILVFQDLPRRGTYHTTNTNAQVEDRNWYFFTQDGIDAKKQYVTDVIRGLMERQAPLESVFSYNIDNEVAYAANKKPFTLTSGTFTGANGKTYNLANQRALLAEEGIVYWSNEITRAIKAIDPTALVAAGFFPPAANSPSGSIQTKLFDMNPDQGGSITDYMDVHMYPDADVPNYGHKGIDLVRQMQSFQLASNSTKPLLMGEMGVFRDFFPDVAPTYGGNGNAANALLDWQKRSCQYGFSGWLIWTWDTGEQELSDIYSATRVNDLISNKLAPRYRPNACQ